SVIEKLRKLEKQARKQGDEVLVMLARMVLEYLEKGWVSEEDADESADRIEEVLKK
uniref:IL7R binder n=1 Tax=Escherichia coli (strain B / BL21-DE3) TaxID=469008 RepID=UPI00201556D2|nr:Chain D, IL7R binder [Escherichia coli BL21(DE3)]7OPB_E Chain E, IL7R binder [Escherichia coli BL21(DE3)]7OPB_F Chain F, IL7R binder [Escherichia coli BL21(DE3)]7S5B_A Chain A, Miniprotein Binder [synthetic construct]7S5B_B Chain B, Miniprotein Binder [synthetic construct]